MVTFVEYLLSNVARRDKRLKATFVCAGVSLGGWSNSSVSPSPTLLTTLYSYVETKGCINIVGWECEESLRIGRC